MLRVAATDDGPSSMIRSCGTRFLLWTTPRREAVTFEAGRRESGQDLGVGWKGLSNSHGLARSAVLMLFQTLGAFRGDRGPTLCQASEDSRSTTSGIKPLPRPSEVGPAHRSPTVQAADQLAQCDELASVAAAHR